MLNIEYFFKIDHAKDDYISPHYHNYYEIAYFESGSGISKTKSHSYQFEPNSLILYTPKSYHDEKHYDDSIVTCIGFSLDDPLLEENLTECYIDSSKIKNINSYLIDIENEYKDRKNMYKIKTSYLISSIIIELLRIVNNKKVEESSQNELINNIKKYINKSFSKPLDINKISEEIGFSYSYCRHLFKEKEGISIKQYLDKVRIKNAKVFLKSTTMRISEISLLCGFDNVYHFSNFFKLHTKISPKNFRNIETELINH